MSTKFIIVVLLWCYTSDAVLIESNFYREETCAKEGGFCVLEKECPGKISNELKSLCDTQASSGAVCCPHVKQEELNCYQLHNECFSTCPAALNLGKKGCSGDLVCCTLIK